MVLEPRAVDIIKAMAAKLADAQSIKFTDAMSIAGEGIAKLGWAIVGSVVISIATMLIGWIVPDKD